MLKNMLLSVGRDAFFLHTYLPLYNCKGDVHTRDGTGQDFLDPTGKFQNHRRLTGRSTGFFTEGFCSLFNVSNEKFSKGGAWVRC